MSAQARAEIVGNVWRVLSAEGDQVERGQVLAIMESMKMEIPVYAPESGVITSLRVLEGQIVQEGDIIAVVG